MTAEQTINSGVIVETARRLHLPPRAAVIAVATALQESRLRNLDGGHADSVGLFQQRPSQGWGQAPTGPGDRRTPQQRLTDPQYAAHAFYRALVTVGGWQTMPLTDAAQAVQHSAFPNAYAQWENLARHAVAVLSAQQCLVASPIEDAGPAAATAVAYAQAQLGLPYEWAGNGPAAGDAGFDCSGLTHAAYEAAGIAIPRTAQTQYNASPRLPAGAAPQPGDLAFFGRGPRAVTHVGIVISRPDDETSRGWMIDAPHRGATVRVERIWRNVVAFARPRLVRD